MLLGLIVGSFLNVCICRIPLGASVAFPPSQCPSCGARLRPIDLVPVLSWIALRGRCRYCQCRISAKYPLVELLTACGYALIYDKVGGYSVTLAASLLLFSTLVVVSFIDFQTSRIPDVVTYPMALVAIGLSALPGGIGLREALVGVAVGGGSLLVVSVITRGAGMGLGDVKLMAVVGAFLGWRGALYSIFLGCLFGGIIGLILMALKVVQRWQPIPFGPFLALGTCAAWAMIVSESRLLPYVLFRRPY